MIPNRSFYLACGALCICMGCGNSNQPGPDGAADIGTASDAAHDGMSGRDASALDSPSFGGDVGTAPDRSVGPVQIGDSGLPNLPELTNVVATQREDSVGIDFDPVDGAQDYRVYVLPSNPADITNNSDGSLTIHNAIYRCAGLRQAYYVPNNDNSINTGNGVYPTSDAGSTLFASIYPYITTQVPTEPVVGYVYAAQAPNTVPVYAVAMYPSHGEAGWRESRAKIYTSDATKHQTLLSQGGRDDGVAFYVPAASSSATQTLYHSENLSGTQHSEYYFTSADMASHANDSTPPAAAFEVLSASGTNTVPLSSVFYQADNPHTELSAGDSRYLRASQQGTGPIWHLEWSGVTQPTTLVVEALANGCPFQGFLSPQALAAPPHQPFLTLSDIQAASPTGEVFINGQFDLPSTNATTYYGSPLLPLPTPTTSPVPIARSFIQVAPQPHDPSAWDWYQGFDTTGTFGPATSVAWPTCNGSTCSRWTSPEFEITGYALDNPNNVTVFTFGQFLGQFWEAFDDTGQDVTGRIRLSAQQRGTIASDPSTFLHVTWSVDTVSTGRRYPQLILSDQPPPLDDGFQNTNGNFLLIQTRQGPSMYFELEAFHGLVNGNAWAVNNQAPPHELINYDDWGNTPMPPAEPPFEHSGVDRMTKYDAFVSSSQLYVFVDGTPAACVQLPTNNGYALTGSVSVTFGDVLYHEGAETEVAACRAPATTAMPFLYNHQCTETKRHWDDLGFKSGVTVTTAAHGAVLSGGFAWDPVNFPCVPY